MKLKHYKTASLISLLALGSMAVFAEKPITQKAEQKQIVISKEVDREIRKITMEHNSIRFNYRYMSRTGPSVYFDFQYQQLSDNLVSFYVVEVPTRRLKEQHAKAQESAANKKANKLIDNIHNQQVMSYILVQGLYNLTTKEALYLHNGKWLTPKTHPSFKKRKKK